MELDKDRLGPTQARYFREELREAKAAALRDAEAFDGIVHVVERIGYVVAGKEKGLHKYKDDVKSVAEKSALCEEVPKKRRSWHTPFSELYDLVRVARNDAFHQGAVARNLTKHALQLSLILEDALVTAANKDEEYKVSDYMVREPVCAYLWQPVSFIRQQMLLNDFSYLPVNLGTDSHPQWKLVSDLSVMSFLRSPGGDYRKLSKDDLAGIRNKKLAKTLEEAKECDLELEEASLCCPGTPVEKAPALLGNGGRPLLVHRPNDTGGLLGIVTAFDLL